MDNLCHTLAGATLARAGLGRYTSRGMATLMIASNLPDIDVAVFATDTLPMSFRRGWTHGVLAMAVLPAVLAAAIYAFDRARAQGSLSHGSSGDARERANLSGLLLLSYLGTWIHVFMDFLNSYGVRLLKPFSERWFYGDALYIVDPVLYLIFGAALVLGRKHARAAVRARMGVAVAAAYMLLMLGSNVWARSVVHEGLLRAGRPADTRFMVTPVIINPFQREVLIDVGTRYEKGFLWFDPLPHFRPAGYGVDKNTDDRYAQQAAATLTGQAYLQWSRFPFFVVQPHANGVRVQLNDYRYAGPGGRDTWLATTIDLPAQ
jgi:inner membrane protein